MPVKNPNEDWIRLIFERGFVTAIESVIQEALEWVSLDIRELILDALKEEVHRMLREDESLKNVIKTRVIRGLKLTKKEKESLLD